MIKGIIIVHVILAIVYLAAPMMKQEQLKIIDESILTNELYKSNIILNIIA